MSTETNKTQQRRKIGDHCPVCGKIITDIRLGRKGRTLYAVHSKKYNSPELGPMEFTTMTCAIGTLPQSKI